MAWASQLPTMTMTAYPDLYVTNVGHNILYHNNGDGTFTDVTNSCGSGGRRLV